MSEGRRTSLKLLAVAIALIVAVVLLYRQRVTSSAEIWDSDLLVFCLPALFAACANAGIIAAARPDRWRVSGKSIAVGVLALAATLPAFCAALVIALNAYGS